MDVTTAIRAARKALVGRKIVQMWRGVWHEKGEDFWNPVLELEDGQGVGLNFTSQDEKFVEGLIVGVGLCLLRKQISEVNIYRYPMVGVALRIEGLSEWFPFVSISKPDGGPTDAGVLLRRHGLDLFMTGINVGSD